MRAYCKAYRLGELRAFPEWDGLAGGADAGLADDVIVYVWDDLTVVRTPVLRDEGVLVDEATPRWREFCATGLRFTARDGATPPAPMGAPG
ncbi:hypothetical protein [Streptomyces sp. NPDC048188]|uniref:hypothetical protein n=1 Tax=Streptomyces sp. NPDC048188 TaxID=3155749 RepID=UPI0034286873